VAYRVIVVGFGRVGGTLARRLSAHHWSVRVVTASTASARRARRAGLREASPDDLRRAHLCFIAVPDRDVGRVAAEIAPRLGPKTALVHCAGALTLSALPKGTRPRGSFHPLLAISNPGAALADGAVALAAETPTLLAQLKRVAGRLNLRVLRVPDPGRIEYHAGAVLAAAGLVALLDAAVAALEQAGLGRIEALRALAPLMRSALRGVEERGLRQGLTGPVARGDLDTVQRHLSRLRPDLASIYRLLGARALALAPDLTRARRRAMARVLR
jgi:predicted short-subunit dehydrogenase-like oxidoreductase (DUF2520 family)